MSIKKILCFCVPLGILATPLILMQLINMMDLPELHIGKVTITKLYSYRIGDFGLSNLSIESIADCLRCIFFDDNDASHIIPAFGTIYKVSIPFFAIGFVNALINIMKSVKKKELNIMMLPFLWFMVVFFVGCCTSHLAVYHVNAIFISVLIFTIEGIVLFIEFINRVTGNIKNFKIGKYFKYITGIVIVGIYFAVFLKFAVYYYGEQYTSDFSTLSLFEHELDEPLSYLLDNEETQNVKDLTTYISGVFKGYIYFLETVKISPQEYNANNPMPGNDDASKVEWERKYNNYIFDMPENIVYNANYIVSCHEKELCQELEDKGFKKKEFDYYNVYVYDMANCSQVTGCADIVWNTGVEDGNRLIVENATQVLDAGESIVLVGYAYDKENMSCYDSIYLTAEKNNYYAEQTERPDVVEQTNEESLNMCGFLFIIPKSDISGRESMTLTLFNNDAHTYEKIEIEVVN